MKDLWKVIWNRIKLGLVDFIMDIFVGSMHEYRNAKKAGAYDIHVKEQREKEFASYENVNNNPQNNRHG